MRTRLSTTQAISIGLVSIEMDANGIWHGLMSVGTDQPRVPRPRILIIGAGSRGNAYARAVTESTSAMVHAVADPISFKRNHLGKRYIWKDELPEAGQAFEDWRAFLHYEQHRRRKLAVGQTAEPGVDAAFICTLDEQHAEIIIGLASLNLHILSEKPLATTLSDCIEIYASRLPNGPTSKPTSIFSIGHVLRYSPHNTLLRQLLLQDRVVGDVISVEHTEPVGWWHFSHSYVRGNWRREDTTAPSLLTKSCHDIDLLLWLLASPADPESDEPPHLPATIASTGKLNYFRRNRKPAAAKEATNCLSCPIEDSCLYSARKIYVEKHLQQGKTGWPVKIVDPEIEDCYQTLGLEAAEKRLLISLREDYAKNEWDEETRKRPWFGRCVWESDNDVCDDQTVTMTWDDVSAPVSSNGDIEQAVGSSSAQQCPTHRYAKTATFHMIAHTQAQCERRGVIYGTEGEITYDSKTIDVYRFANGELQTYHPQQMPGGHGGGDDGLIRQFVKAVEAVMNDELDVKQAQKRYVGCTLEDVLRSHAMVFAAEEARLGNKVVEWPKWWSTAVHLRLRQIDDPSIRDANEVDRDWEVVSPQ